MKWNHILIEGYCARDWEWRSKHSKYHYKVDLDRKHPFKARKNDRVLNPKYDPDIKKPKRPSYCEKRICSACIPCDHLAFCDVDEELRKRFTKLFHDYCDEMDREEEDGLK